MMRSYYGLLRKIVKGIIKWYEGKEMLITYAYINYGQIICKKMSFVIWEMDMITLDWVFMVWERDIYGLMLRINF